jgi:hypothetical protein
MTAEFLYLFLQNISLMKGCVSACDVRLEKKVSSMILLIIER